MSRHRFVSGVTFLILGGWDCRAATAPSSAPGVFIVASVDGRPLPVLADGSSDSTLMILNEQLWLRGTGTATRFRTVARASAVFTQSLTWAYTDHDGVIQFRSPSCGPPEMCTSAANGLIVADTLTLTFDVPPPTAAGRVFVYHRAPGFIE